MTSPPAKPIISPSLSFPREFMYRAVSSVMAVWMLVLTAAGWCCHPPSQCARVSAAQPGSSVSHSDHCPCCDDTAGTNDESQTPPVDAPPCNDVACHGVCTYLPTSQSVVAPDDATSTCGLVAYPATAKHARIDAGSVAWVTDWHRFATSHRLHLIHQIFLI